MIVQIQLMAVLLDSIVIWVVFLRVFPGIPTRRCGTRYPDPTRRPATRYPDLSPEFFQSRTPTRTRKYPGTRTRKFPGTRSGYPVPGTGYPKKMAKYFPYFFLCYFVSAYVYIFSFILYSEHSKIVSLYMQTTSNTYEGGQW